MCVPVRKIVRGYYAAMLPADSVRARLFIETYVGGAVYSYALQKMRFEGNRRYFYLFVLTEKGLELAKYGVDISGWEVIEQDVVIY